MVEKSLAASPRRPRGGTLLWFSTIVAFGSLAVYLGQVLVLRRLTVPWYLSILGGVALIAAVVSFVRSPSWRRGLIVIPVALVAAAEVWIVSIGSLLPAYHGPLRPDSAFPPFTAIRADGSTFTDVDLRGQSTVLTFFRGRW